MTISKPGGWIIWAGRYATRPSTYLIFNNHARAEANALEMLERLTDQRPALPDV
jgi:hypothetical protein